VKSKTAKNERDEQETKSELSKSSAVGGFEETSLTFCSHFVGDLYSSDDAA